MNILITIGVVGSIFLFNYLFSKWSGRMLGVVEVDIEETEGEKVYRWGRITLLVIYFIAVVISIEFGRGVTEYHFLYFIAALWLFRSLIEWKYMKGSRQYLRTLMDAVFLIASLFFTFELLSRYPIW
jgi:hypothetical protein